MPETKAVVLATTDYSKFKLLDFNRAVSKEHVQRLVISFEAHPELIIAAPILVNERLEVVDGQHRLAACEALGLPVPYLVIKGASIESAQVLNVTQKGWRLLDFARSYAGLGNPHYQQYLEWIEEYNLTPSALYGVVFNASGGGSFSRLFREGKMVVKDRAVVEARLELIGRYRQVTKHYRSPGFTRAILRLSQLEGFSHDQMIEQLATQSLEVSMGSGQGTYLRALEIAYNKGKHKYLRFF